MKVRVLKIQRNIVFFISCLFFTSTTFAQTSAPAIQWQKNLGGTNYDIANSIEQTSDGNYIIVGNSQSADGDETINHGGDDYWIVKLTETKNIVWQKSIGGSQSDIPNSIHQTFDGGYIVGGWSASNDGDVTGTIQLPWEEILMIIG
jgi:hypothetical protein